MGGLVDPVDPAPHSLPERLAEATPASDPLDRQAVLARVQRGLFQGAEDPVRIGRFIVIQRLGAGASGVVFAAYDPQLDRKIALKVLRTDADLPADAHTRLRREAQALARLSHPHVVAVHDVGEVDGRVFIAMELLRGGTLRQWVQAEARRPPEVLAAYLQAGEGLAAAHAAGLVHRDFKPDNVLLDRKGRVRVVDFGLAREHGDPGVSMIEAVVTGEQPRLELHDPLTRTGTVMGTPAYMAPEQHAGRPADARTDQYSFCVALYEALYGERPLGGDTLPALAVAAQRGQVRPPPAGTAVPAWIRRALLRGLRPEPALRYPDMAALLAALRRDPGARWRRWGRTALGLSVLVGATWIAAERSPDPAATCSGFDGRLAGVWDRPRREALAQALASGGQPGGAEAWARVQPGLSAYADAWVQARRDACEATEVRHEQSDDLLDRRVLCLDRALLSLEAAVDRLADADAETVMRAAELVPDRALIDECSARGVLDDGEPPPADPATREQLAALEDRIAHAQSLLLAGKYPEGLERARQIEQQAASLDHAPTRARVGRLLGSALIHARQIPEAIDALSGALAWAEAGRADRTRALINHLLVKRLADTGQFDEARRRAAVTEALYDRLAHPPAGAEARGQLLWGHIEWTQGHYEAAFERYDRAIALTEGSDDPEVMAFHSEALVHRGTATLEYEQPEPAREYLQRGLALRTELDGPDHPELAAVLTNLAGAEQRLGRPEQAERLLRRSLELRQRRLGPDHESLAPTLANLGALLLGADRPTEAIPVLQRAIALTERSLGPQSADLAVPLHNLALALLRTDKRDQALATVHRAREIRRRALGPAHPRTLTSEYQVAYLEAEAGRYPQAHAAYRRYIDLVREHQPEKTQWQVEGLVGLADVCLLQEQPAEAQAAMEQALALLGDDPDQARLRLAVEFDLAQALHRQGRDRARARSLAEQALARAQTVPGTEAERETIARWLAEHAPREASVPPASSP